MPNRRKNQYATTASVRNPPPKLSMANNLARPNTCRLLVGERCRVNCPVGAVSIRLETNQYAMAAASPSTEYPRNMAAYAAEIGIPRHRFRAIGNAAARAPAAPPASSTRWYQENAQVRSRSDTRPG